MPSHAFKIKDLEIGLGVGRHEKAPEWSHGGPKFTIMTEVLWTTY